MSGEAKLVKKKGRGQGKRNKEENGGLGNSHSLTEKSSKKGQAFMGNGNKDVSKGKKNTTPEVEKDCSDLVLWKSPFRVLYYSSCELVLTLAEWVRALLARKLTCLLVLSLLGAYIALHHVPGPHQAQMALIDKYLIWYGWWVGLGILSSVGLGTGLHTFILYLGPHIAAVTLAAYECQSTDFPEPPYPDQIVCPEAATPGFSVWDILRKVYIEAFCWGVGTAIGELPPYFMARAARLSGKEPGDDMKEMLELKARGNMDESSLTFYQKWELKVERLVERAGFLGIMLCASVPNPLFDLAGITCGHFLVPFWTFFGATLIGKAVNKMTIQMLFVIFAFNETLLEWAMALLRCIPVVGDKLEAPVRRMLVQQKEKLHRGGGAAGAAGGSEGNILSAVFEKFVLAMVAYFIISIINSLAQSYEKRRSKRED